MPFTKSNKINPPAGFSITESQAKNPMQPMSLMMSDNEDKEMMHFVIVQSRSYTLKLNGQQIAVLTSHFQQAVELSNELKHFTLDP